jgi:peptidoglycan/LPS O-acetylase OafA/YrhL
MERGRLHGLDALRGIAALIVAVFAHEYFLLGRFHGGPLYSIPAFAWAEDHGSTMVDLFFVISGFVFSHVYLQGSALTVSARQFAQARFARLYPLHLITWLATAAILTFGTPVMAAYMKNDAWHFALGLLMLQEGGLNNGPSFNVAAWSISVEVYCYIVFLFVAGRYSRISLPLAGGLVLLGVALSLSPDVRIHHLGRGFLGFFMGTLAWRVRDAPTPACLLAICGGVAFAAMDTGLYIGAALSLACFPALVILAPRVRLLASPPLLWLGDRSYAVYLVHVPLYYAVSVFVFGGKPVPEQLVAVTLLLAVFALLVLADLSYRSFERPVRHWLRGLGSAQTTVNAATGMTNSPVAKHSIVKSASSILPP